MAVIHRIQQVWGPIMSQWLKLNHTVCDRNVHKGSSFLALYDIWWYSQEITEKHCIRERYPSLDSDNNAWTSHL